MAQVVNCTAVVAGFPVAVGEQVLICSQLVADCVGVPVEGHVFAELVVV